MDRWLYTDRFTDKPERCTGEGTMVYRSDDPVTLPYALSIELGNRAGVALARENRG
jgi:hypothetical protein